MHGTSFKELALGNQPADWRSSFLCYYKKDLGDTPTCVGVRTENAKLIYYKDKPEFTEAYDLTKDPYELRNLAHDSAFTTPLHAELIRLATKFNYPLSVPEKP